MLMTAFNRNDVTKPALQCLQAVTAGQPGSWDLLLT